MNLSPQEIIEAGVSFDTFAPQFFWLLIIGFPEAKITKQVMGPITPIIGLALVHLTIVLVAAAQEGALEQVLIFQEVFDPSMSQLAGMQKLFEIPNFVAEEWPHVLIWDLAVGRAIWLDSLERGVNARLSLAFCNFIGPPGLGETSVLDGMILLITTYNSFIQHTLLVLTLEMPTKKNTKLPSQLVLWTHGLDNPRAFFLGASLKIGQFKLYPNNRFSVFLI